MARPPRIDGISYAGRFTYLVTTTTRDRVKAFEDLDFGRLAERELLAIAERERFTLPAYCLMPDHIHVVATGQGADSNLRRLVGSWKQKTGYLWSKRGCGRLWQTGYWDRLSRFDEPVSDMVRYVVYNPVRAGIATEPVSYPLTGSTESTIERICASLTERRH
jgi:putative transposase